MQTASRLVIDKGCKKAELYEYHPLQPVVGPLVPSFDIGKKHFGVYIHSIASGRAVYAGIWKLGEKMDLKTQMRLTMLMDRLDVFFQASRVVLVEAQRIQNPVCLRLQQHLLSYLELKYPQIDAVTVASDIKYRRMGGPLGDQKHKRKQWAITKSLELFDELEDPVASFVRKLDALRLSEKELSLKSDDVCDSYLQFCGWRTKCTPKEEKKWFQ